MDPDRIFALYKPFRNQLRKLNIVDSLYVIWAYIMNLQFGNKIPENIQVDVKYRSAEEDYAAGVYEWELETLAREIILHGQETSSDISIKKWHILAKTINRLKKFEEDLTRQYITDDNSLIELHRIAHREFPWQSKINISDLNRYYMIFKDDVINNIIKSKTGLSIKELYKIGLAASGLFGKRFIIKYPLSSSIFGITAEKIIRFMDIFAKDMHSLKEILIGEQQLNEKFAYSFQSLRAYPLIILNINGWGYVICPFPTLLLWRLTNGLFYEICNEKGFDCAYGISFQRYVGQVLSKANKNKNYAIYNEKEYYDGSKRKDTVDWIIYDQTSSLFIECKAKRLVFAAKTEIASDIMIRLELDKMAEYIVQVYKTIIEYKNNKYPEFKYEASLKLYPLIVTLEEWYLFGFKLQGILREKVDNKLTEQSICTAIVAECPYSICSIKDLENIVQIIDIVGMDSFLKRKTASGEKLDASFGPFINSEFPNEEAGIQPLFDNVFDELKSKEE